MIDLQIDTVKFVASLKALVHDTEKNARFSALDIGNEVLRLSQQEVPHDEGTLQNSGTVEQDGDNVIVGYHTEYAARLHEHPEYKFKKGRKGKYLEDPITRNQDVLGFQFSMKMKEGL
jgi:hypothetical protein